MHGDGDLSDRYLGVKIVIKIHQNFLTCLLVYICGVFLTFLVVSGRSVSFSSAIVRYIYNSPTVVLKLVKESPRNTKNAKKTP